MSETRISLDLNHHHWRREIRGGYVFYGTWFRTEDGWQPCIAITPSFRAISFQHTQPCVVLLRNAFHWQEEAYAGENAGKFLAAMGLAWDGRRAMHLALAINDHLGDLIAMPPRPADIDQEVGEIIATDADGKARHATIHDVA